VADVGVPKMGVTKVGEVANTFAPLPVSSVKAAAKFALLGVAKKVATPVPNPDTPVLIGKPVAFVKVPEDGVPNAGVTKVGDVANTNEPEPVSSVIAEARLALEGVAKRVATPVPKPLTPVEIGRPVAFVKTAALGVPRAGVTSVGEFDNTTLVVPVLVVTPVPPLATGNVPVTPVVRGKPVKLVATPDVGVPSNGVTKVGLVDNTTLPDPVEVVTPVPPCRTVKAVVRPVIEVMSELAPLEAALRLVRAFAAVEAPVPPSATAKSVMPVIVPPVMVALEDVSGPVTPAVAVTAPVSVDAPVTFKVVLAVIALAARVVLATVAVPVAAPMFTAVAAPAKFTVVAVVLTRAKVVDGVVMSVVTAGEVKFVVPVDVSVPVTDKVLPEPTLRPTLVPLPAAANSASTWSRSVLTLVPQEFAEAPTSGFVKPKLVVVESAMINLR
jgi:hypothetical protein